MSALEDEILRYFAGELSPSEARALRERLREDAAGRAIYDRQAALLGAVSERDTPRAEHERIWEGIEAALDAPRVAAPSRSSAPIWRLLPALAGALLVAGLVLVVARPGPEVGYKGGGAPTIADVDFDLFALHTTPQGGFSAPRRVAAGGTLALRDAIQFRVRSGDAALDKLVLGAFVATEQPGARQVLFYFPAPLPIQSGKQLEPVGRSIRLAVRHRPGPLTLFAIFAEQAPSREVMERALGRVATGKTTRLEGWPGKVALLRKSYVLVAGKEAR